MGLRRQNALELLRWMERLRDSRGQSTRRWIERRRLVSLRPSLQGPWHPFFSFGEGNLPYVIPNGVKQARAEEPSLLVPPNAAELLLADSPVGAKYPRPTYEPVKRRIRIEKRASEDEVPRRKAEERVKKNVEEKAMDILQARARGDPKVMRRLIDVPERILKKHGVRGTGKEPL